MKYFILTYGCQMNKNDSEHIAGYLQAQGFVPAKHEQEADYLILNTCAVRDKSERRVYGKLHELNSQRQKGRKIKLAVSGCIPRYDQEKLLKNLPFIDEIIDLNEAKKYPPAREKRETAWITIQDGCNHFCSYCIVPHARGREAYRTAEDILKEVKNINQKEYNYLCLLGQNINTYHGFYAKENKYINFGSILKLVHELLNDHIKLEFLTSHPKDMEKDFIDTMAKLEKLHKEIHIPVQSGNNYILKK